LAEGGAGASLPTGGLGPFGPSVRPPLQDELAERDQPAVWDELPARRDLETLLSGLPKAQQQAIALIKLEGLSGTEASRRTGVSASALKVQVHRGLKRLAELVRKT
jgi:RNA polymerase sigma-70 factor (ECF subfamily)